MSTYYRGRRAHIILEHLALPGTFRFAELFDLFPARGSLRTPRFKLDQILIALREDGLITGAMNAYTITTQGEAALAQLDAGKHYRADRQQTSVRVFARRDAA